MMTALPQQRTLKRLLEGMLDMSPQLAARQVNGLTLDSRKVGNNDLFFALAKDSSQRSTHLKQAVSKGCGVVLFDRDHALTQQDETLLEENVLALAIVDLADKAAEIAARFYGHPSLSLTVIAVTGTNGKTSVTQFIAQCLENAGYACGVIGTLGVGRVGSMENTGMTTPDPVTVQAVLADFYQQSISYVVMEASSHALEQGRLNSVAVDVAVLTNLSRDHLDYHKDLASYAQAKMRLFAFNSVTTAIVNKDDQFGQTVLAELVQRNDVTTLDYGCQDKASLSANTITNSLAGLSFMLKYGQQAARVNTTLLGHFNIENLLATAGVLLSLGFSLEKVAGWLSQCQSIDGRMQSYCNEGTAHFVIDFAHSPDALAQALSSLRPHLPEDGKLWCVFGCGGDRDKGKRPLMGESAEKWADHIVLTSDNPRSENNAEIASDILAGIAEPEFVHIKHDREKAIAYVAKQATHADIVLVAGKGHETYQEFQGIKETFSDQQVVLNVIGKENDDVTSLALTLADCASLLKCDSPQGQAVITGAQIDSRKVGKNDLFVALAGERVDGHDYIAQARQAGASAALVTHYVDDQLPQLVVKDIKEAFAKLAHYYRTLSGAVVVAITGSNGKTTVKEMVAKILGQSHQVLATEGNLNNELGVPLTLFRLQRKHDYAVIEMGANHPGEIARLVRIAEPKVALINNVAPAHLEGFGTIEGVAKAKAEIYSQLDKSGTAIVNADMPFLSQWQSQLDDTKMVTFALENKADIHADLIQLDENESHFTVITANGSFNVMLPLPGMHNVANALAAIAVCDALTISVNDIISGLANVKGAPHRLQIRQAKGHALLIDDSYNANPGSYQQALNTLSNFSGKHWLVLGDFGELGTDSKQVHYQLGKVAKDAAIDRLWTVGEQSQLACDGFGGGAEHFTDVMELQRRLESELTKGVICLIKGSRFMQLDKLADALAVAGEN